MRGNLLTHLYVSGFVENGVDKRRLLDLAGKSTSQSDDCKMKQAKLKLEIKHTH